MSSEQLGRGIKPFSIIPNEILDAAPDYHVVMVWCAIWRHANGSEEGCWASVQRISKVARIGIHRPRDAIKWLKENGWLIAVERPGFTTRYRCTMEGGTGRRIAPQPLAGAASGPLPTPVTPSSPCKGYPLQPQEGEQYPLELDPNSLLSTDISYEISSDAAANALAAPSKPSKRKPRAKGSEEFERFWKLYLSAPIRAGSQSKPKALSQWQKTIRTESEDSLIKALETEIEHQQAAGDAFVSPLPDCFRWLRDERYATVKDRPAGQTAINHATYVF